MSKKIQAAKNSIIKKKLKAKKKMVKFWLVEKTKQRQTKLTENSIIKKKLKAKKNMVKFWLVKKT